MIQSCQKKILQRNTFSFEHHNKTIIFDSNFDSGNLARVDRLSNNYHFCLWTASDCEGTDKEGYSKSWFYFSVQGFINTKITFSIHRIHVLWSLMKSPQKYRPVYRRSNSKWQRLQTPIKSIQLNSNDEIVLTFDFFFQNEEKIQFAYTYPYSYTDCQQQLEKYKAVHEISSQFYYKQHLLCKSFENRNIDLIMISSHESKQGFQIINKTNFLKEQKLIKFAIQKPIILITARVHPIQTPSSYCMKGIIDFLTNKKDARAYFLRKYFVFLLVPMLNPDGVANGHCRMDMLNQNLNRYYKNPDTIEQPSCYAIKQLVTHYHKDKRLFFYLDLHAHPANKGNFIFGNAIFDYILQVQSTLFPKLLSNNCINFHFQQCNFSRKHMKAKDRFEQLNKQGCGRVVLYKQFGIIHSYTLECGYHSNTQNNKLEEISDKNKIFRLKHRINQSKKIYESQTIVKQKIEGQQYLECEYDPLDDITSQYYKQPIVFYQERTFINLGKNILISILDIWNKNPYPRVKQPNQIRREIAQNNSKMQRFKKQQSHLKTKQKNIVQLIEDNYYSTWYKRNACNFQKNKRRITPINFLGPSLSLLKRKQKVLSIDKKYANEQILLNHQEQKSQGLEIIEQKQVLQPNCELNTMVKKKQINIRISTKKIN